MRLHWFMPALPKKGLIRRALKRIGPTWRASPVRRLVQTGCLGVFLWLFLYVSWPYTARPARVWHGWLPVEVDAVTGEITVSADQQPAEPFSPDTVLYVSDASAEGNDAFGRFRISSVAGPEIELAPVEPLSAPELDALSASFGPWSLSETEPGTWPSHYADDFQAKAKLPPEIFLMIDPLVSISAALAAKCWVWSLNAAGAILLVCIVIPRGFCGYVCPLGTLIDLFDWAVGKRVTRFRAAGRGWWVHVKYYLLLATLIASLFGVLVSGFVAAIPVVTRGMAFLITPLEMGFSRGWHQVPSVGPGHFVSIGLLLMIFGLGFFRPRFWCRYVCPTGAVFSLGSLLRTSERKVESSCIHCEQCVEGCPFDAIKPDFTTRATDCTFCQTCGGVCPTHSIKFVPRWDKANLEPAGDPATGPTPHGRRRFLGTVVGAAAGAVGGVGAAAACKAFGANLDGPDTQAIVRPPGSVPEQEFLQLCIRCGQCFQACPNNVLQPLGFAQGLEGLWTPQVVANWSGCEPSCTNCGRVCPTGAIRALPLEEKRAARMGLAVVDQQTCLPLA